MSALIPALLAIVVFASAAAGELVQIATVRRITAARPNPHGIARLGVLEWLIGAVGWIVVVRTQDLAYLVPEVIGLYCGSWLGARLSTG